MMQKNLREHTLSPIFHLYFHRFICKIHPMHTSCTSIRPCTEAMRCCEHKLAVDDGSSTLRTGNVNQDHPWHRIFGFFSSNYSLIFIFHLLPLLFLLLLFLLLLRFTLFFCHSSAISVKVGTSLSNKNKS